MSPYGLNPASGVLDKAYCIQLILVAGSRESTELSGACL